MDAVKSRDEDLVSEFLSSGTRSSLAELTQRHLGRIRSMVYSMLLNDAEADDVTQEIFLKVYRGLSTFQGEAAFSTWLYRIAMNSVYTHLRRRERSPVTFRTNVPEAMESPRADEGIREREAGDEIAAALAELSPSLRAAVVLVCLEGREAAEAAEIEGCTVSTIYWRVHEARKQLEVRLAEFLT
jgi:RNA polymerase sigma-70 factor (ECF subfamily)